MMIALALLLVTVALAEQPPCTRDYIINGILTFADTDADGHVTAQEINAYFSYRPCGDDPLHAIGEYIVANRTDGGCSMSGVGYLQESDYDAAGSCAEVDALRLFLCAKIYACEVYNQV